MIEFNMSMDFEMGWGDLERVANDPDFYQRVIEGHLHTPAVIDILNTRRLPSTWGIVGACCCNDLQEISERAPEAFASVEPRLSALIARHQRFEEVLFCADTVAAITQQKLIEVGSHSFVHIIPNGLPLMTLRDDVAASVRILREVAGRQVESFIPPQNYEWPDAAFDDTGIRYVRHTPHVFGFPYSNPALPAKISRLWNDFVAPVSHRQERVSRSGPARLLFLRIDRGPRLWRAQLKLIREMLRSATGSLYCFSHPHNLDSTTVLKRFEQFCDSIAEAREQGRLAFTGFVRKVDAGLTAA